MKVYMKKINKSYTILFIITLYFILSLFLFKGKLFPLSINIFKFCIIILLCIIAIIVIKYTDKIRKIENKFFVIATFFGIILIFANPVLHGIDEGAHFFKVYTIFNDLEIIKNESGAILYNVPEGILKADEVDSYFDELEILSEKINENNKKPTDSYLGITLYSDLAYITYLVSMFFCQKVFNLGIVQTVLIGRLFSFIIWLCISTYTIKIIPKRKTLMAFLCLLPINLTLVTSYTGDLITNSTILLFIAYWYKLYEEKRAIKKSEIVIITILGILAACSKIVYALIFFIILFLPQENFKNKKHNISIKLFVIVTILITSFINLNFVGKDLISTYPSILEQKAWISNNFFMYVFIFIRTIVSNLYLYLCQFTTGHNTMLQNTIYVNELISLSYFCILICSLFIEKNEIKLSKKAMVTIFIIIMIIVISILTSLYLQWTGSQYGIGYSYIMGVQGRYFLPIVALLFLINTNNNVRINKKFLWNGVIIINYIILLKIFIKF